MVNISTNISTKISTKDMAFNLTDDIINNNIIQEWKDKIDSMSHIELARLLRFAPNGHPVFNNQYPLYEYSQKRFQSLGGMTPEISKEIGWGR